MLKKERAWLFRELFSQEDAGCSVSDAWERMSAVLEEIESKHAPEGMERMVILGLDNKDVKVYGQGGAVIPLLGYTIYINANGAVRIENSYTPKELVWLEKRGADGVGFVEERGWDYFKESRRFREGLLAHSTKAGEDIPEI